MKIIGTERDYQRYIINYLPDNNGYIERNDDIKHIVFQVCFCMRCIMNCADGSKLNGEW